VVRKGELPGLSFRIHGFGRCGKERRPASLNGCPMFAPAYMGRKWILRMLSLHGQRFLILAAAFCRVAKALEGAAPRLFRPMYAGANMGHPSREQGFVLHHNHSYPNPISDPQDASHFIQILFVESLSCSGAVFHSGNQVGVERRGARFAQRPLIEE
jgi:hypothetical protein